MAGERVLLRLAHELSRALDQADRLAPGAAPGGAGLDELIDLLERAGARSRRLVPREAAEPDRLRELEERAVRRWEAGAREREGHVRDRDLAAVRRRVERRVGQSLTQYWELELPGDAADPDAADAEVARVLEALSGIEVVEWAVRAPELVEAAVTHADEFYADQRYLHPAPGGIGVEAAWDAGYSGGGLLLIDVERGWRFGHPDLPTNAGSLFYGKNHPPGEDHGTAVLGIVAAIDGPPAPNPSDPAQGVVGVAPDAQVRASSRVNGQTEYDLVGAIIKAVLHSPPPDVLLIEVQLNLKVEHGGDLWYAKYPVELLAPYWAAIWVATTLGVAVVEPAGNGSTGSVLTSNQPGGGIDLDEVAEDAATAAAVAGDTKWTQSGSAIVELDPTKPGFCDSGAIMVGAAYEAVEIAGAKVGHRAVDEADWGSNYGKRVDCYAWGENVRTTSGSGGYRGDFDGTSSASAIVAGAALLVQEMHVERKGIRASPRELRDLLSDPGLNTPHVGARPIGAMPNLKRIHRELLPWKAVLWLEKLMQLFGMKEQ